MTSMTHVVDLYSPEDVSVAADFDNVPHPGAVPLGMYVSMRLGVDNEVERLLFMESADGKFRGLNYLATYRDLSNYLMRKDGSIIEYPKPVSRERSTK